jgi:hypothetical protein
MGPRPGGGRWRPFDLDAARWRAEGLTWAAIHNTITARGIKYSLRTLENLTYREWWSTAYNFFASNRTIALEAERAEAIGVEREKYRDNDAKLKALGTQLALTKLIEVLQGFKPRDEGRYRQLVRGGKHTTEDADLEARKAGKLPTPADQVWAAKEMLKATGYTALNDALAKASVESESEARKIAGMGSPGGPGGKGGPQVLRVSVEMTGVDMGAADAGSDDGHT